jgi:LemA protein
MYSRGMFENIITAIFEFASPTTLIGIVGTVVCLIWLAASYAKLSKLRNEIDIAFDKIDVHIKERHHLAPSLLELTKQHTQNSPSITILIDNAMRARHTMATAAERVRTFSNDTSSINSLVNADVAFSLALERVSALQTTHAELGNDELFKKLAKNLSAIENNISFTHKLYNDVVNSYNSACATFPAVLLAGALGFRTAGTLAAAEKRSAGGSKLSQA